MVGIPAPKTRVRRISKRARTCVLTREKKVDMGENLSHQPGDANDFYYKYLFPVWVCVGVCGCVCVCFFFNSLRTGLYSSKAVSVIRKNTELL